MSVINVPRRCQCYSKWHNVYAFCILITILLMATEIHTLTGHVCRRLTQENHLVESTRAFLCNERYTTSCGHLDWRRCTRYRVQTCYTPTQRYATRYREVEECCPGWQQSAGSCSIPVCHGLCQNGGICSQSGAVPHCSCLPGYYGDHCQHKKERPAPSSSPVSSPSPKLASTSSLPPWVVSLIVIVIVAVLTAAGLVGFFIFKLRPRHSMLSTSPGQTPSQVPPTTASSTATSTLPSASRTDKNPSPLHQSSLDKMSNSALKSRIVQPSAPSSDEGVR